HQVRVDECHDLVDIGDHVHGPQVVERIRVEEADGARYAVGDQQDVSLPGDPVAAIATPGATRSNGARILGSMGAWHPFGSARTTLRDPIALISGAAGSTRSSAAALATCFHGTGVDPLFLVRGSPGCTGGGADSQHRFRRVSKTIRHR